MFLSFLAYKPSRDSTVLSVYFKTKMTLDYALKGFMISYGFCLETSLMLDSLVTFLRITFTSTVVLFPLKISLPPPRDLQIEIDLTCVSVRLRDWASCFLSAPTT